MQLTWPGMNLTFCTGMCDGRWTRLVYTVSCVDVRYMYKLNPSTLTRVALPDTISGQTPRSENNLFSVPLSYVEKSVLS